MKRVRFNFGETPFKFMDADSSSRTRTRGRYCASKTTTNKFKKCEYKVFLLYFFLVANCVKKSANTKWKWKWRNFSTSPAHLNKKSKEMIMQWRKQRGDRWDETKWREERWETTLYCSLFILLIYYLCSVPTSSSAYACQGKGEGAIFRGCDAWTWSGEESTSQSVEDTFAIATGVAATAQFPQAATAAATALKIPQQISFSRQSQSSSTVLPSKPAQPQLWAATPTQSQPEPTGSGLISSPQQQASQSLAHTDTHTLHHSASAGASYGLLRENRRHLLH